MLNYLVCSIFSVNELAVRYLLENGADPTILIKETKKYPYKKVNNAYTVEYPIIQLAIYVWCMKETETDKNKMLTIITLLIEYGCGNHMTEQNCVVNSGPDSTKYTPLELVDSMRFVDQATSSTSSKIMSNLMPSRNKYNNLVSLLQKWTPQPGSTLPREQNDILSHKQAEVNQNKEDKSREYQVVAQTVEVKPLTYSPTRPNKNEKGDYYYLEKGGRKSKKQRKSKKSNKKSKKSRKSKKSNRRSKKSRR